MFVLCDSKILVKRTIQRYGVDKERLIAMPFTAAPFTGKQHALSKAEVLKKYDINEGYFFYPAQFWSHKNHVRILQALKILKDQGKEHHFVFCGKDYGNLEYVKDVVSQLNLEKQITFVGFIPADDIRGLYEGCSAVVMPSYFGPTNLPPLEAWAIGKPLIYSAHLSEQAGDAALLFDPDSATELANAITAVLEPVVFQKLIKNGKRRLIEIDEERILAEKDISTKLDILAKRRFCWL